MHHLIRREYDWVSAYCYRCYEKFSPYQNKESEIRSQSRGYWPFYINKRIVYFIISFRDLTLDQHDLVNEGCFIECYVPSYKSPYNVQYEFSPASPSTSDDHDHLLQISQTTCRYF